MGGKGETKKEGEREKRGVMRHSTKSVKHINSKDIIDDK